MFSVNQSLSNITNFFKEISKITLPLTPLQERIASLSAIALSCLSVGLFIVHRLYRYFKAKKINVEESLNQTKDINKIAQKTLLKSQEREKQSESSELKEKAKEIDRLISSEIDTKEPKLEANPRFSAFYNDLLTPSNTQLRQDFLLVIGWWNFKEIRLDLLIEAIEIQISSDKVDLTQREMILQFANELVNRGIVNSAEKLKNVISQARSKNIQTLSELANRLEQAKPFQPVELAKFNYTPVCKDQKKLLEDIQNPKNHKQLVQQLTTDFNHLISHFFKSVHFSEFHQQAWNKQPIKSPNLTELIQISNQITYFTLNLLLNPQLEFSVGQSEINTKEQCQALQAKFHADKKKLLLPRLDLLVKTFTFFLKLETQLIGTHNYLAAAAIHHALVHSSVDRVLNYIRVESTAKKDEIKEIENLREEFIKIKKQLKGIGKKIKNYSLLFNIEHNSDKLRTHLNKIRNQLIPLVAIILQDLTFIDDGNKSFKDELKAELNIDKLQLLSTSENQIIEWQQRLPAVLEHYYLNFNLPAWLKQLTINDNTIYNYADLLRGRLPTLNQDKK